MATCSICGMGLSVSTNKHDMVDCVDELKRRLDEAEADCERLRDALEQKTDRVAEVIKQREEAFAELAELDAETRRMRRGGWE